MHFRRFILTSLVAFFAFWPLVMEGARKSIPHEAKASSEATVSKKEKLEKVKSFLRGIELKHGGIEVGIVLNGEILLVDSYGNKSDSRKKERLKATDLVHTASLTKQFTGWAIAKLASEGKVSLADPLSKYLTINDGISDITIKDLVGFTEGLASPDSLLDMTSRRKLKFDQKDAVEVTLRQKTRERNKVGSYGNAGYVLLAEVIGKISGVPYERYVRDEILSTAGMKDSFFQTDCNSISSEIVTSTVFNEAFEAVEYGYFNCILGAMGLVANAEDLSKWVLFLMRQRKLDSPVYKIFSSIVSDVRLEDQDVPAMFGYFLYQDPSKRDGKSGESSQPDYLISSGNIGGFNHIIRLEQDADTGVLVLGTAATIDVEDIAAKLHSILRARKDVDVQSGVHICDVEVTERLAGIYEWNYHFPLGFQLVSDGKCLWYHDIFGRKPVFSTEEKGKYRLANSRSMYFYETVNLNFEKRTTDLFLKEKYALTRVYPVDVRRFPVSHLLGEYRSKNGQKLTIRIKENRLVSHFRGVGQFELFSGSNGFLFTENPATSAIKIRTNAKGEVVGIEMSNSRIMGTLYQKDVLGKISKEDSDDDRHFSNGADSGFERLEKKLMEAHKILSPFDSDPAALMKFLSHVSEDVNGSLRDDEVSALIRYFAISEIRNCTVGGFPPSENEKFQRLNSRFLSELNDSKKRSKWRNLLPIFSSEMLTGNLGEPDFFKFIELLRDNWKVQLPSRQYQMALAIYNWEPATAKRIFENSAKGGNKKAKKFIEANYQN